jgi:hypothetical protein
MLPARGDTSMRGVVQRKALRRTAIATIAWGMVQESRRHVCIALAACDFDALAPASLLSFIQYGVRFMASAHDCFVGRFSEQLTASDNWLKTGYSVLSK